MKIVSPEEVGASSERVMRLTDFTQSYVDQNIIAGGITMLVRHGKVFHFETYGMMDIEAQKKMQPDTLFRIYSMSKPITCVAVMMLFEEGKLQLSDPVSKYIPAFEGVKVFAGENNGSMETVEAERTVTIHQLLTHTSGLVYGIPQGPPVHVRIWQDKLDAVLDLPEETLESWVQRLVKVPLAFQPGSRWEYGLSTDVLGYLVEVVSGMSFGAFLEQRILQPLGMADTGFYVPEEKLHRLAVMYGPTKDKKLDVIDPAANGRFSKPPKFLSGGAGLVSTTSDYMRFAQMLLNGGVLYGTRLLGRKTVELMTLNHQLAADHTPIQLGPGFDGYGYGLGFGIRTNVALSGRPGSRGEYMWGGAASTHFWVDPREQFIGLIMTQFFPNWLLPNGFSFSNLAYFSLVE